MGLLVLYSGADDLLRLHSATIEQALDDIIVAGLDGAVKYLNPAWADMHGYTVEELEDANIRVFHTEEQWTDELRMENQLRQSHKMKVVGQLAGGVAHDLDNMLSPILGYAELLLADMFPVDPKYEDRMQIKAAAERTRDLTHELLAFSRKQVLEMKAVDLAEVVASYGKMLRQTIREDIGIQIRGALSRGAVRVDVGQIGQVLMNLAVNCELKRTEV